MDKLLEANSYKVCLYFLNILSQRIRTKFDNSLKKFLEKFNFIYDI